MSQKTKFSINSIQLPGMSIRSIEDDFDKNGYTEEAGIGIVEHSSDGDMIAGVLLKRVPTFINEYHVRTGSYEKRQVFIFQQMQFEIDLSFNLLYTVGAQGNLSTVRTFLKNALSRPVAMSTIETSPYNTFKLLKKAKVKFNVTHINIDQFNYNGAIGKFSAVVTESAVASELISIYKEGVSKIAFDIQFDGTVFSAHVYPAGVIGIVCDDEYQRDYFDFIKQILFK